MFWLWFILIVPGMICLYALVIRGLLHKVPALQKFYAQADGFWAKVWALCGNSLVIAWMHIVGGLGSLLEFISPIASALGDPDLKQQITDSLQMNPELLGKILIGISIISIASRLRTLGKGGD